MAQGRSTEIITMITWIRTSRLSIKELSLWELGEGTAGEEREKDTDLSSLDTGGGHVPAARGG